MKKKWVAPDRVALCKPFEEELAPLRKQCASFEKKISAICKKREKLLEETDRDILNTLPKNIERYTDEQWAWILDTGHGESTCHYKAKTKIFEDFGLSCFGFHEETRQPCINLHKYGFKDEGGLEKVLKGLNLLIPHFKPVTVVDHFYGIDIGVRIAVYGIEEDTTSVVYVHKKGDVVLYKSKWGTPKKFNDLKDFLEWYAYQFANSNEEESE